MIEESIAEHHVLPHVNFLAKQLIKFEFRLIFDQFGIEEALRNLDVLKVLDQKIKTSETLWDCSGLSLTAQPGIGDPWNQSN